jgi:hypothetical protein
MNGKDVQSHIEELVAAEHKLMDAAEANPLSAEDTAKLADINVQLDRYYDLLRQRRAREEFAQDPESAHLRAGETVEKYLQ